MKLTSKNLIKLVEEVILESIEDDKIDWGGPEFAAGLKAGNKRSLSLFGRGKQSAHGLRNYIAKATEHASPSFRAGYEFAFKLRFSAQLSDPIPDGRLPYSGARQPPSWLFDPTLNRPKNFRRLKESKMRPMTGPTLKMYLDPNFGQFYGTAVDKQLRQRKVLIAAAKASAIHEQPFPEDELWQLLGDLPTANKLIDAAKKAYVKAGGLIAMGE